LVKLNVVGANNPIRNEVVFVDFQRRSFHICARIRD
jgi:hypothetical protein